MFMGFSAYCSFLGNFRRATPSHSIPPNWSHLPDEILDLIFACTKDPIDILRWSAVCKSWQPTALQVYRKIFPLCFIQPNRNSDDNFVLFNILNKETRKIQLPEAKGKSILCGYNGWLLTLDHSNSSPRLHLLNIFSRTQILLPRTSSQPKPFPDRSVDFKGKLHLSECPMNSDCRVLLLYDHEGQSIVLSCKPGYKEWFHHEVTHQISDVIWPTGWNCHFSIRTRSPNGTKPASMNGFSVDLKDKTDVLFLVNLLDDDYLGLVCYSREDPGGKFFDVSEFEKKCAKEYRKVKDLEGCTLFMSPNGCHLAKTGNFKANCIYFIRQSEGDCLIYDMETGQSELVAFPGLVGNGSSLISWVIPDV